MKNINQAPGGTPNQMQTRSGKPSKFLLASAVFTALTVGTIFIMGAALWLWLTLCVSLAAFAGAVVARTITLRALNSKPVAADNAYISKARELRREINKMSYLKALNEYEVQLKTTENYLMGFEQKIKNFQKLMNETFAEDELTFGRYMTAYENLLASTLDHMNSAHYVFTNLSTLSPVSENNNTPTQQRKTLENDLNQLLKETEAANATLDEAYRNVANIKNEKDFGQLKLDQAIKQMENLSQRASKYSQH